MKKKNFLPADKPLGQRVLDGLNQAIAAKRSGRPAGDCFRVDTVEVPDPPKYGAAQVKALREKIGVTQRVFARIIGVSPELVEGWEQGLHKPRPMACLLLGAVERDPSAFFRRTAVARRQQSVI